jgi:hypothetical protein
MKLLKSYLLNNDVKWDDLIVKSLKLRDEYIEVRSNSKWNRLYALLSHISSLRNMNKRYNKNYLALPYKYERDLIKYANRNHSQIPFNFLVFDNKMRTRKKICFKNWLSNLWLFLKNIFYGDKYLPLVRFIEDLKRKIFNGQVEKAFFYGLIYRPDYYLAALVLSQYVDVLYITGSASFYYNRRYVYLPDVTLVSCSLVQYTEINSLIEKGSIVIKDKLLGKPLFNQSNMKKYDNFSYDIGIYSSGEWAREDGLLRSYDYKKISLGHFYNNPYYAIFISILKSIIDLITSKKFKVKLYFHPYEKDLFNKHGIMPPYLNALKKNGIDFSFSDEESTLLLRESKIGVAVLSTIIYERLGLGLDGYLYYNSNNDFISNFFNPSLLGDFKRNFFKDVEELKKKIIDSL